MALTPIRLSDIPAVGEYVAGDALLIIRDGEYTRLNELPQGLQGEEGPPGENGESPAFRREGGFLQFKLPSDLDWTNLVPLADITGEPGESIELQTTATHIQYRVVGDIDWINLIELALLEGEQGLQGEPGADGGSGVVFTGFNTQFNSVDNPVATFSVAPNTTVEYFLDALSGTPDCHVEFIGDGMAVQLKTNFGDLVIAVRGSTGTTTNYTIDVDNDGSFLSLTAGRIVISSNAGYTPVFVWFDADSTTNATVQAAI